MKSQTCSSVYIYCVLQKHPVSNYKHEDIYTSKKCKMAKYYNIIGNLCSLIVVVQRSGCKSDHEKCLP